MPLRTRTKKSFSARTSLRTLRSKATDTRLTSIQPESLIDPPPPELPELGLGDFSVSAEADLIFNGSPIGTAATGLGIIIGESNMVMAGSSSGVETGTFSCISEGIVTFGGAIASSAADFSSDSESSMEFVGVEQSVAIGDWSSTAESTVELQGGAGAGTAPGEFFSGAESSMSMIGTTATAVEGDISISAESVVTVSGASIRASNISVLAEAVSTLRGASVNPSRLFSAGEAAVTLQSDDEPTAGVYTDGPLAAQQVSPYTAYLTYLDTWENWLGADVQMAQDLISYTGGATTAANWTKISTPTNVYGWGTWKAAQSGREVMIRVPMSAQFVAPDTLPSNLCQQIASGTFDSHFQTLATNLNNNGLGAAHLRIGSRLNASSEPWYSPVGSSNASNFGAAFRRIVDVMEAQVPSNDWKFSIAVEAEAASLGLSWWNLIWPGDTYVQKIGIHVYDQSWLFGTTVSYIDNTMSEATKATRRAQVWDQINGWLLFIRDFAIAHNKAISFDEWALVQRTDNHGGGDNPTFIQNVHSFINTPANRVFSQCYANQNWSSGQRCELHPPASNNTAATDFPSGASKYIELFGEGAPPPPPPPSTDVGVGVFFEGGRPPESLEPSYVNWLGRAPDVNADFCWGGNGSAGINGNWTFLTNPNSISGSWDNFGAWLNSHPGRRMDIALGMQPWSTSATGSSSGTSGDLLGQVAAGSHDSKIAQWSNIMSGLGLLRSDRPTYIRLGWEMDGRFFPWGVASPASGIVNYAPAWRRFVDVIRGTLPSAIINFVFCPTYHGWTNTSFINTIWPGDSYVDMVGADFYDNFTGFYPPANSTTRLQSWNNYQLVKLQAMNNFAIAHGKRQILGEYGVSSFITGGVDVGGGDNPDFIQKTYDWAISHNDAETGFEYIIQYDDDESSTNRHRLSFSSAFPNSATKFKQTFGLLTHPW